MDPGKPWKFFHGPGNLWKPLQKSWNIFIIKPRKFQTTFEKITLQNNTFHYFLFVGYDKN